MVVTVCLGLGGLLHLEVWARQGGLKAPFLEEVHIGLETGPLVPLVGDEFDLVQSFKGSHDELLMIVCRLNEY